MPSTMVLRGASSRHLISHSSDIFRLCISGNKRSGSTAALHRTARWLKGRRPGSSVLDALGVDELAIEEAVAINCGTTYQNQPNA